MEDSFTLPTSIEVTDRELMKFLATFAPGIDRIILGSEYATNRVEFGHYLDGFGVVYTRKRSKGDRGIIRYDLVHDIFGGLGSIWLTFIKEDLTAIEFIKGKGPTKEESEAYSKSRWFTKTTTFIEILNIYISDSPDYDLANRRVRVGREIMLLFVDKINRMFIVPAAKQESVVIPTKNEQPIRKIRNDVIERVALALYLPTIGHAKTKTGAAQKAKVSKQTITRREKDPQVQAKLNEFRQKPDEVNKLRQRLAAKGSRKDNQPDKS